jgi:hypothetical protein
MTRWALVLKQLRRISPLFPAGLGALASFSMDLAN